MVPEIQQSVVFFKPSNKWKQSILLIAITLSYYLTARLGLILLMKTPMRRRFGCPLVLPLQQFYLQDTGFGQLFF